MIFFAGCRGFRLLLHEESIDGSVSTGNLFSGMNNIVKMLEHNFYWLSVGSTFQRISLYPPKYYWRKHYPN